MALCRRIFVSQNIIIKGFPYGIGALQRGCSMGTALSKGGSLLKRLLVKEIPHGKALLKRLAAKGIPHGKSSLQREQLFLKEGPY